MINQNLLVISIFLFLIMTTRLYFFSKDFFKNKNELEYFENNKNLEKFEPLERPFCNIYDDKGNLLNVTLLSRPFYYPKHYKIYNEKILNKFNVLGISSYQEFPNQPINPRDNYNNTTNIYNKNEWISKCKGWLHCFKNPDDYLPKSMKKILMSESDFCDCNINKPNKDVKKKYDFIYICHRDDLKDCSADEWVAYNKNLSLAKKCISLLCEENKNRTNEKKIKGLLIGRSGCELPEGCSGFDIESFSNEKTKEFLDIDIITTNKLGYYELNKKYDEARLIFIPNIHDASPRVVTEAFGHNIPCLMNQNIVGGWKYIKSFDGHNEFPTGEFFNDEKDFKEKFLKIIDNIDIYEPRKFFVKNYGIVKTGRKLKNFIYEIFGDKINIPKENVDYVCPEFKKIDFQECFI